MTGKILSFIALLILLAACGSNVSAIPTRTPMLPLVIMDEVHNLDQNTAYAIPPGNGFMLDSRSYKYKIPPTASGPLVPNFFQIIGNNQYYGIDWQSKEKLHNITSDQLKPLSGAKPFNGFKKGQRFVMAVGNMTNGSFIPLWTATLEVR